MRPMGPLQVTTRYRFDALASAKHSEWVVTVGKDTTSQLRTGAEVVWELAYGSARDGLLIQEADCIALTGHGVGAHDRDGSGVYDVEHDVVASEYRLTDGAGGTPRGAHVVRAR